MLAKVTKIGNSTGLILPKEAVAHLKVSKGDSVFLTETPDGYAITPYDAEIAEQLDVGRAIAKRYRNALKKLAE